MVLIDQFSTTSLEPAAKLSYWNDVAMSTVGPVMIERLGQGEFEAQLTRIRLPEIELVSPRSSPAVVRNRRCDSDRFALNLTVQHIGSSWSTTGGRTVTLEPGDIVLYDPTQSLECRFNSPIQQIVVRLPYVELAERFRDVQRFVGVPLRGGDGAGKLISTFVRNTWKELHAYSGGEWANSLGDVMWPLLALAYGSDRATQATASVRERRQRQMLACIDAKLTESEFGTVGIAEALGVTARYVQMLFAQMQTTPSAFILNRRLELAAHQLAKRGADVAITDVAFDVGFEHLSTFCRAFRHKYQVSPREYRAGIRSR
jgi:AraC-like DNA-binding protein